MIPEPTARLVTGSRLAAVSEVALAAFGPVWMALITAIGLPRDFYFIRLYWTTASTIGKR